MIGRWPRPWYRRAAAASIALVISPHLSYAQGCPSSDVNDVLNDPRVQEQLDQAWRDSMEGTENEHEEGGWIQQCRMENVLTGEVRYYTQVLRWPHGTLAESYSLYPPPQDASCRTVASFHTHPGPAAGHPSADGYDNDRPSTEDMLASAGEGMPGIIRFGSGDDTTDFTYGYNRMTEPRDPGWRCPDEESLPGRGFGDPHMVTLDGLAYDFMGIGDFVLMRSPTDDVEIQARLQPYKSLTAAAVTTAIAVRDGRDRLEWRLGHDEVFVNGKPQRLEPGAVVRLRSHGALRRTDEGPLFVSSAGDRLRVTFSADAVDYEFTAAAHRARSTLGLFGNFDGDPDNDLRSADGTTIAPRPADAPDYRQPLYAGFGESWRVPAAATLFTTPYAAPTGVDVRTFPRPAAPASEETRAAALAACRAAGVVDPSVLDACVFDRTHTGSDAFMAAAANADRDVRESVPLARAGAVDVDRERQGRLEGTTREVAYTIALTADTYLFDARGSRGTSWRLIASNGDDMLAGASEMNEYPSRLTLPAGAYRLVVSLVPDAPAGRFRFRVRRPEESAPSPLAIDAVMAGRIDTPGQMRTYLLQLPVGRYDFEPAMKGELWWSLTDSPGNEFFDANQRVYMERAAGIQISAAGPYTLTVSGRYWVGTGTYQLRVAKGR